MWEGSEVRKDAHVIGGGSGGFEGRRVEIPSEPDTTSRKSYISSSESGESEDSGSEYELSDRDERHDYVGFKDIESLTSSESDILTEQEEEELRGRRHVRARSGRRVVGGRMGIRRRGLGRASSSRSRSPIETGGEGDDDGWVEENTLPTVHLFTATPGLTCCVPTTPLGFFQLFVPFVLLLFFVEETNDYAYYHREKCTYVWSGVDVQDIAQYLGIVMWMGIIGLPEMRMYWARNMTFSLSTFSQMMSRRRFEAIQKYFHSLNRTAIPKGNPDKLMIIRPVLDFIIEKCCSLYVPLRNLSIDKGMLKWNGHLSIRVYNPWSWLCHT